MTPENVGDKVHLRVELQALWRLPRSNAIVFSIRGYLIKAFGDRHRPQVAAPAASRAENAAAGDRRL